LDDLNIPKMPFFFPSAWDDNDAGMDVREGLFTGNNDFAREEGVFSSDSSET
jgi:hypothetical protein